MNHRLRGMHALVPACLILLLAACRTDRTPQRPGAEFTAYVPAFTAGHISARGPVLVRIADGLLLKDSSEAALQGLIELEPRVPGTVHWRDAHTLAFQPSERLKQATVYNAVFHLGRLAEVPDNVQEFHFGFTTYAQHIDLRLADVQPLDPNDLRWQRVSVDLFTGDDATGQDLAACLAATQGGRRLTVHWEHAPGGTLHHAVADSVRRGERADSVVFSWDAKVLGGDGSGQRAIRIPALGEMELIHASASTDDEAFASLLFSDPLDATQELNGLAGIAGLDDCRLSVQGNRLLIHPPQRPSGAQRAFIAAGLRNTAGRTLGKDITVDLLFDPTKPAVRAVGHGTILPSTSGLLFPFEAVNLRAVDVRIIRIYADNVPQFLQVNTLDGEQELARVARPVMRTTVKLDGPEKAKPDEWTRYYLDLDKLLRAEPGAIYRVILGFKQAYATCDCGGTPDEGLLAATTDQEDEVRWDSPDNLYYYDEGYYAEDYDHEDRDDPCTPSYYANKGNAMQRNILASDLGLLAKRGNDGSLLLAVTDLRTTAPVQGVKFQVLDMQLRTIAEPMSDAKGMASLPPNGRKAFLVKASKGNQRGYLKVDDGSALSVSEFDVQGETVEKGLKGFLYGERGVWRPGDTLHLAFMLQQPAQPLPKDMPVILELTDPLGRLAQRTVRTSGTDGLYAFPCTTAPDAPTGLWHARVTVGGADFHLPLRIETVKPNRIRIALDLGKEPLTTTNGQPVQLRAEWLHGAAAKDLATKVTVSLTRADAVFKAFPQHDFNDLGHDLAAEESVLFDGRLDAQGRASFPFRPPLNHHAPAAVRANVVARVFEPGGAASTDRTEATWYPWASYAGIRVPEATGLWGNYFTDTTYVLDLAAVSADGKPLAGHTLEVQTVKVNHDWWWSGDMDGPTNYLTAPSSRLMDRQQLTTGADGRVSYRFRVNRPLWGRFVVRVSDPASGQACAAQLYVDWPGTDGRSRREDGKDAAMLRFNSDKHQYAPGDECTITFPSPAKGRALVSIENGSRVLSAQWVELQDKETTFRFPITADMAPNVYAHVTLLQPHDLTAARADGSANDLPLRLYGVLPIAVTDARTRLEPAIKAPAAIRTDAPFTVDVAERNGRAMTYTLAIVDEGLLDLTRFKTPDPWGHFHAREALGVRSWDLYDEVIGAFGQRLRHVLALGGSDAAVNPGEAKAQRFTPVVRFAGPFRLEKGGKATHRFTINNYVGSVRIMVVAMAGPNAYGNAEKAVPVKKPLMVLATLPRVAGPGETVDLPVAVFAMEPQVKDVRVDLAANELFTVQGDARQEVHFTGTGERTVYFRVKLKDRTGTGQVSITASGAGEKAVQSIELAVRRAGQAATDATDAVVEPGTEWSTTPQALGVAGTNHAWLEVSTLPPLNLGRRLQYLIDYPHGCLEQTVSKAFPQLFLADVMDLDANTVAEMRANVEAALRKVQDFRTGSGGFSYWPGQREVDDWTSVYTGHFLVEAEAKGFALLPGLKDAWINWTRRQARDWAANDAKGRAMDRSALTQAYRLYALALANAAEPGAINRLRTTPGIGLQARWMLAAAYALHGRKDVARELALDLATSVPAYNETGYTYGSDLRDAAIIAEALMRMDDKAKALPVAQWIGERLGSGQWYSTQSTAWALLAVARTAGGTTPDKAMRFRVAINGRKAEARFSERPVARVDLPVPDGRGGISLANTGNGPLFVRLVRTGVPPPGEERPASNGLGLAVEWTTMEGRPLDPAQLQQGTDFMATVTVSNPGMRGRIDQLALTQVFPSGWEIRNSRLEGTDATLRNSPFDHQDIRDDRVLTYFSLGPGESRTWRIALNAAYTGRFHLPATVCEAMYDHALNARSAGQWVQVVKAGE
jgi:uncharacterized protein YfaS (alpha-2-macroglobulin family)